MDILRAEWETLQAFISDWNTYVEKYPVELAAIYRYPAIDIEVRMAALKYTNNWSSKPAVMTFFHNEVKHIASDLKRHISAIREIGFD